MSTTHPTDITTEWDDIQRKHGNLPKLIKGKTTEELDSEFVRTTEDELLRQVRLKELKRKFYSKNKLYGTPVHIDCNNFIKEVTNSSKCSGGEDFSLSSIPINRGCTPEADLREAEGKLNRDAVCKTTSDGMNSKRSDGYSPEIVGNYVPVLLYGDGEDVNVFKRAWIVLAKRYPHIKFTMGNVVNVLKCSDKNIKPPSSILLYYAGDSILQKSTASILKLNYELKSATVEERLANSIQLVLNSVKGHSPFTRRFDDSSDDENDSSDEDDEDMFKSSGKDLKCNFLNNLTKGNINNKNSKSYTSWILDKAIGE